MRDIASIRSQSDTILAIGSYHPAYQAILDFDFLCGRTKPSLTAIVTSSGRFEKFFWGNNEVLIPCFSTIADAKRAGISADWLLNVSSARRALSTTEEFFTDYPQSFGAHIFAEDVPEQHALKLYQRYQQTGKMIVGPAGVGLLVPGSLKLGVIGGVDWRQLQHNHLQTPGSVAVLAASGGMINEIITMVSRKHRVSFALCFGGDRFPATTPVEAFLAAENDPATTAIVYYGELGGQDEYDVAARIHDGLITKPIIAYIAGTIGESFAEPVQFGHAKALAQHADETASAKRNALEKAGVTVAASMRQCSEAIEHIPGKPGATDLEHTIAPTRRQSSFSSTISQEDSGAYQYLGRSLPDWSQTNDMALLVASSILGHRPKSPVTIDFVRTVFLLSVDHGPQVSGALTTIITARAGKGLVDSLAAGLLTIGPRFGGAVSSAAAEWFDGVTSGESAETRVERYARNKRRIGGIGHKKYRLGLADPRTDVLRTFTDQLPAHPYYDYAKSVEKVTTAKKGNLILNVDGHIAALMLDILAEHEGYDKTTLKQLIDIDFFNALFVIPRIVGFTAHYLDQKRLDEGLFRLPDDDILLS